MIYTCLPLYSSVVTAAFSTLLPIRDAVRIICWGHDVNDRTQLQARVYVALVRVQHYNFGINLTLTPTAKLKVFLTLTTTVKLKVF